MIGYIDRDLIRSFLVSFIILMIFVQIGVLVYTLLDQYRYMSGDDSKLGWVGLYFILTLPRQLVYTFPVATAVSVLWTYTVKARQNELLAYFVGGISPTRVAAPLLVTAGFLSVTSYLITEFLATEGDKNAERIEKLHIQERRLESVTKEKNVFQKGQGSRFYNVAAFNPSELKMEQPIVIQMTEDWTGPLWRVDAAYAEASSGDDNAQWIFRDVYYREFDNQGNVTRFEHLPMMNGDELKPPIEKELDRYIKQRFRPEQMSVIELREYIDLFKSQNRRDPKLETILHFNFAIPFGCFVLALVMCGHILRPRSTGVVIGFGGGLVLLTLYFGVLILGREFAMKGALPAMIGAYLPNILFLGVGLYLLGRNRAV